MATHAHTLRKIFAANMRARRRELKVSQEKLAELCGLHQTYISEVEGGKRNVSIDNIGVIAEALNLPAASLLIPRP